MSDDPPDYEITDDTPLRLDAAAKLAFPNGGMTASGLRREWARGKLDIYRVAGKDYTTLAAIKKMRIKCQDPYRRPDSTSDAAPTVPATGSSSTKDNKSAQARLKMIAQGLKRRSPNT
jgi:hypothetical protein